MLFKSLILIVKGIPVLFAFVVRMIMWAAVVIIGVAACVLVALIAAIPMIAGFIVIVGAVYALVTAALASIVMLLAILSAIRVFAVAAPLTAAMILLFLLGLYSVYLLIRNKLPRPKGTEYLWWRRHYLENNVG